MLPAGKPCRSDPRYVGDPIDVVTGANADAPADLVQRGPILFQWVRCYSSARCQTQGPLGWGHSHDFDRLLYRDLDGLRYEDPFRRVTGFEDLAVGSRQAANGMLLTRTGDHSYVVAQPGEPDQEFRFSRGRDVAQLACLRSGEHTIEFRYTDDGILNEIIDSRARRIRVVTDRPGRILRLELADPTTGRPAQVLLAYEYDAAGNLIRATDLYKTTLTFAYDAGNRMSRRTDRRGYSFHFEYDDQGRCVHSRGDDGLFEVFLTYDPEARTTFVRRGDGGQWIYFYNEAGAITQVTDPYGNATQYVQDDLGRTVQEVDPSGNITQFHYDWLGKHDYRIDPLGHVLPTNEDDPNPPDPLAYHLPETPLEWEFGRLLDARKIRPPRGDDPILAAFPASVFNTVLGKTATGERLSDGNPVPEPAGETTVSDDYGRTLEQTGPRFSERWKYDPNGNLVEHQDRDGSLYRFVYSSWNALHQQIDPLGHATCFDYTRQGQVARVTDPGGTVSEFTYDLKDRLREVRRDGRLCESFRHDAAGNIVEKKDGQGRTLLTFEIGPGNLDKVRRLASGEEHLFEYDARGRVTEAKTPSGTATLFYDADGHLLKDQRDGKGVTHDFEFGRLSGTTYFGKFNVCYETLAPGDLLVRDPTGGQHRLTFCQGGLVARFLANGTRELCHFDAQARCRLKAVVSADTGLAPWMRTYAYSYAGDLVALANTSGGVTRYRHDAAHRLAEEALPRSSRRFEYDAAGNLLLQPGLKTVQLLQPGNRLRAANGDRFTYNDRDHVGVRTGPTRTDHYEYNELGMLVRCQVGGADWAASYDALCRRVQKTWQGRTTTYYWDDFRLSGEVRPDGSLRIYVYVDDIALVPFLFLEYAHLDAEPESGKRYYVFTNQIGVPVRVEDDAGKVCWSALIDPYGQVQVSPDSTLEMSLRFPGHYHDPETGLHYNRYRYYSPELGRYLQSDPAGVRGGINLYAYPADPLTAVDIDGLARKPGTVAPPGGWPGTPGCKKPSPIPQAGGPPPPRPPFEGVPPVGGKTTGQIRQDLRAAGFQPHPSGGSSEVWRRTTPDGATEQVRIDAKGHPRDPDQAHLPKATTEDPHAHKERFPPGRDPDRHRPDKYDDHNTHVQVPGGTPANAQEARDQKDAQEAVHIPIKG
jgi:RHS repeat-associated protein